MIEFDTPLTDREKVIAIVAACPFPDINKFYRSCAINIRCALPHLEDGVMDDLIHNAFNTLGLFYREAKNNKVRMFNHTKENN